jgi:type VI protein secretion system component Hcp
MSSSVAEIYLLLLRPTTIPIAGEAVPTPFDGQIELDSWNWSLLNRDHTKRERERAAAEERRQQDKNIAAGLISSIEAIRSVHGTPPKDQLAEIDKEIEEAKPKTVEDEEREKLTFSFKKGVDLATTQMLNSMKAGDVFPHATLTLHHRSKNAPLSLVIKFEKVRLTEYGLSVDTTDTMSDMREEWTAEFEGVDYVYQNRPAASGANGATKGTARVFKMKTPLPF